MTSEFLRSMVFSVCFLHIFLQGKYASALMWSGCRKRSCQGWMWMRCQAAAFAGWHGGWSIALFGSSYVLDLTLPSQHCPIVTFMVQVCQRLGFSKLRHRRQPMALNKQLPMKWITRRVRRFTRRPAVVRFVCSLGRKNLTTQCCN